MTARCVLVVLAAGLAKRYGGCKPLAPLGPRGEAVIDWTAGDALRAGFSGVVLVLGPSTGPAIEYHVRQTWPAHVDVEVAYQTVPLGTAHAVICARRLVGERPFAVVNADDIYGTGAFTLLSRHLAGDGIESAGSIAHALVAFKLSQTVITDAPVTRGICQVDPQRRLVAVHERRLIERSQGNLFHAGDGGDPEWLDPSALTSMNLWGFFPSIWPLIEDAVCKAHPEVSPDGSLAPGAELDNSDEVLLPEVIGAAASDNCHPLAVEVIEAPGRCIGVTHADDLPVVRAELAAMVAAGERPPRPFDAIG